MGQDDQPSSVVPLARTTMQAGQVVVEVERAAPVEAGVLVVSASARPLTVSPSEPISLITSAVATAPTAAIPEDNPVAEGVVQDSTMQGIDSSDVSPQSTQSHVSPAATNTPVAVPAPASVPACAAPRAAPPPPPPLPRDDQVQHNGLPPPPPLVTQPLQPKPKPKKPRGRRKKELDRGRVSFRYRAAGGSHRIILVDPLPSSP
ncbi:BQ5605_C039g11807 [Microbotryum silenes-dioicae]|uniref:BQ5605_C039g11807 protein n=1 Tax=Microbotryum silenes-dioicae TaxID=796604 RepID=A0A2X0MI17_9BASI|nr:BQ5605_C039g11807 [Microbotryum silenes-dioicae]